MARRASIFIAAVVSGLGAGAAQSENLTTSLTNAFGTPGSLIDMPTAEMAPEGQLSTAITHFAGSTRATFSFQLTPRISGSFRYAGIKNLEATGYTLPIYYDRSFDIRYRLLDETEFRPAIAIGLQDFIGTGLYGGEYVVATKSFADERLKVSAGLGWGRLGSFNSFGSTGTRPTGLLGQGGIPTFDRWFRGDVAGFAGISYDLTDRITLKAEYSSDAYTREMNTSIATPPQYPALFQRKSPWNFGLDYKLGDNSQMSLYAMHGSEVGVNFSFALNAKNPTVRGGIEQAPLPVALRDRKSAADLGWANDPARKSGVRQAVAKSLANEDIKLYALELGGTHAKVLIQNERYDMRSQSLGRTTRALTRTLPASVETFTIAHVVSGMPTAAVTINRSDVERLEYAAASDMLARAQFSDAFGMDRGLEVSEDLYPRLNWSFSPYVSLSVFDPESPVRADLGLRLKGDYTFAPGWIASGSVSAKLGGNLSGLTKKKPSGLPNVRSNVSLYAKTNDPVIDHLTLAKYGRVGPNLYGRVTAGYLEQMFAGVSGELLWKPVDSRLALGVEANYVKQREFAQQFGLQNYEVATGHVSAYYDFGNGFHGQLDVGRYLAGDFGATVSIDREFANGWRVGAYATKTNVSSATFGEGSFDKGIRVQVPLSWVSGKPTKETARTTIKSLSRDGGARLNVQGRLYDKVRSTHQPEVAKTWGKFWR